MGYERVLELLAQGVTVLFAVYLAKRMLRGIVPFGVKFFMAVYFHSLNFGASIGIRNGFVSVVLYIVVSLMRFLGILKYVWPRVYYRPDYNQALMKVEQILKRQGITSRWIELVIDDPFVHMVSLRPKGLRENQSKKQIEALIQKKKLPYETYLNIKSDTFELLLPRSWVVSKFSPK